MPKLKATPTHRPAWAVRLRAARVMRSYTQTDMAKLLGISQQAYAGYESGKREPNIVNLIGISLHLGITLDFLLMGDTSGRENISRTQKSA